MQLLKMTLIAGLLGLASCTDGELVAPESIQAAKGGNPGKPGGGDGGGGSYTLIDLGTDLGLRDINDDGVLVGGTDDQAAVWFQVGGLPLLLGDPLGAGSWGTRINAAGTRVIGGHWNAAQNIQHGDLWQLDDPTPTRISLNPLAGDDDAVPTGINDNDMEQIVGYSLQLASSAQRAVLWDELGTPTDLGHLPGGSGSWAHSINNAGHVVGRSKIGGEPRAVLWVLDGTSATILDLTADSDDSGDNHALDITEPLDGLVKISGYTSVAGQVRPTVWTVDVETKVVTVVRLEEGSGWGRAINENGEVVLTGGAVWTLEGNSVESLPTLSDRCSSSATRINNSGTVIGRSGVRVRGRCVMHAVLWTKN